MIHDISQAAFLQWLLRNNVVDVTLKGIGIFGLDILQQTMCIILGMYCISHAMIPVATFTNLV